jgi:hypothetical protein
LPQTYPAVNRDMPSPLASIVWERPVGTPYPELAAPSRLTLARVWAPYLRFHLGEASQITLVTGKRVSRDRGSSA